MTRLEIEGPEEVTRNNPGLFNCVVHYNDATTDNANPEWSIVEGEEYAEISEDGQLSGIGSDIDETIILQAKFTDHYITDSSRLSVRVVMAPTNISETSLENEFRIFPNPASGSLQISYYVENPGTLKLYIYDQHGSLVDQTETGWLTAGPQSMQMDVSHMKAGVYFIRIESENKTSTRKFILHE